MEKLIVEFVLEEGVRLKQSNKDVTQDILDDKVSQIKACIERCSIGTFFIASIKENKVMVIDILTYTHTFYLPSRLDRPKVGELYEIIFTPDNVILHTSPIPTTDEK
jgi:hypothetical protein